MCAKGFESRRYCDEHILNTHGQGIESDNHATENQQTSYKRDECDDILHSNKNIEKHRALEHEAENGLICNQCGIICEDVKVLVAHILDRHGTNAEVINCPHCDYKAIDKETVYMHIDTAHLELTLLGNITQNQTVLADKFETFKDELTNILNVIIDGHNGMKQELFIMRQHEKTIDEKISKTENAINVLTTKLEGRFKETPIKTPLLTSMCPDLKPALVSGG